MTDEMSEVQTPREYWIAIRPSVVAPLNVFGPYSISEAESFRAAWVKSYPTSAIISAVFHAESRDLANQHAHFYIPR